jgi:Fe-only nitrogenase delta subunit
MTTVTQQPVPPQQTSAPAPPVVLETDEVTATRVEQLCEVIMKKCLWQFHSRSWDRLRQNERILGMTTSLLKDEEVDVSDPLDRCYWVDARYLAESYRERFEWFHEMSAEQIDHLLSVLKERLDVLTVTKSLNEELPDQHY